MEKTTCNHTLGYTERDAYNCIETTFVDTTDCLDSLKALKKTDGCLYKFCPHCGMSNDGIVELKIKEIEKVIEKQKKKEEKENKKRQDQFNQIAKELSQKTKVNLLPEEGSFIVIFHPFLPHATKDYIFSGTKEQIIRNCTHATSNCVSTRETMNIKQVYKIPSLEDFSSQMVNQGFKVKNGTNFVFERVIDTNLSQTIDYSPSSGIAYISTYRITDEPVSYSDKTHDEISISSLKLLNIDIKLEPVVMA